LPLGQQRCNEVGSKHGSSVGFSGTVEHDPAVGWPAAAGWEMFVVQPPPPDGECLAGLVGRNGAGSRLRTNPTDDRGGLGSVKQRWAAAGEGPRSGGDISMRID
jgi:hypothetical protein